MKDLVQTAKTIKTIVAQDNPRSVAHLETRYSHESSRIAELKPTAKTAAHKQTQEAIIAAAKQRLDNYEHKKAKDGIEYTDLTVELTHAHWNASLLDLDAKTMKYAADRGINLSAATGESREYKKRLKMFLTAVAYKDATKLDKAMIALQAHMNAVKPKEMTVSQVQKIMGHATPTQASYFKKFGHLLGVVTATRSNQVPMTVNHDSPVTQDFMSL